jgi:hypothetical protein
MRVEELKRKADARKQEMRRAQALLEAEDRKRQHQVGPAKGNKRNQPNTQSPVTYKRMEQNYKQRVLMPELRKRKKELMQKRELHKPISKDEIAEHAAWHDKVME